MMEIKSAIINTPLGDMLVVGSNKELYLLEFTDESKINTKLSRLSQVLGVDIASGNNIITSSIEREMTEYFAGNLKEFKTPLNLIGSNFRKKTWQALSNISYGSTKSYKQLAEDIGSPLACRAVANSNAANQIVIVVPCHRVINSSGTLGGYSCGLERKKYLLDHEKYWTLS